jgi:hypothetical protein
MRRGAKKDNPEAVYVSGYFFNGGPLVAQLRAGGVSCGPTRIVWMSGVSSVVGLLYSSMEGILWTLWPGSCF